MKQNLVAILTLLISSLIIALPLLKPGFYTVHDDQQFARLYVFDQAFKDGQFPVRWVDGLGFGFGYPLFVFYPPLVYMLGEAFHLIGFGIIDSIKLVFFLSVFASGISMYVLAKEFSGKTPATIAALFYMFAPYRAIDIYIRGALAESFAFVWLPITLWALFKLIRTNQSRYIYFSAVFLSLVMITHNLIFLPFMLILPVFLLFLILTTGRKISNIYRLALSVMLALGISAFFWIPALSLKKFTIVDQLLLVNLANFKIHFVYPEQLWNWPWGFGGSAQGTADGLSFKIGKLHILTSVATFILAIIHLYYVNKNLRARIFKLRFSIMIFLLFLVAGFLTTFYAKAVWEFIQPLQYLQFPWRFLTFSVLFSAILAGFLIDFLRVPILKIISSLVLVTLLVIPNLKLFKPQTYRPNLIDEIATSKETINWDVSSSSFEYLPKGVELYKGNLGTNIVNIQKDQIPQNKLEIISGEGQIHTKKQTTSKLIFSINARSEAKIRANIFNFPGWNLEIDGLKEKIDDNNKLKVITFTVPKGYHEVKILFNNTDLIKSANFISFASLMFLILLISKSAIFARRKPRQKWRMNFKQT